MTTTAIPSWNAMGVLPPFHSGAPTDVDRSPYVVSLADLVLHFDTSKERHAILRGFLEFRAALHRVGLLQGFQWLDGSFVENVESIETRAPRDVDVVTFFYMPSGETQQSLSQRDGALFAPREAKNRYRVDAYFVQLDAQDPEDLVRQSTYWYSVWSHRRSGEWKGYLKLDLDPTDDPAAREMLTTPPSHGGPS